MSNLKRMHSLYKKISKLTNQKNNNFIISFVDMSKDWVNAFVEIKLIRIKMNENSLLCQVLMTVSSTHDCVKYSWLCQVLMTVSSTHYCVKYSWLRQVLIKYLLMWK